jgi:hypothetical protein
MKYHALLLTILMLTGVVLPMLPMAHPQIPRDGNSEPLEFSNSPTSGNNSTDWQRDTTFTSEEITVAEGHMGEFSLNIDQGTWWFGSKRENSTWVSLQQRDFLTGDYVYLECKNDIKEQIKCWLRGTVTNEYNFWISMSGGQWSDDIVSYYTDRYTMNFTDVLEYGFPLIWDETNSRLGIKVSGTFDIDPTISDLDESLVQRSNYKERVVQLGHFEYIFYKEGAVAPNNWLKYIYRNTTNVANGDTSWYNGTKVNSVNRTYSTNQNYIQKTDDTGGGYGFAFKSNGTHIYGFVAVNGGNCGPRSTTSCGNGNVGAFLLFNVTRAGDAHNVTGYNVGGLVIHTNASVPCLGEGDPGTCGHWDQENGDCQASGACGLDVSMNSTGFPMIIYTSQRSQGTNTKFAPQIIVTIAENPVGSNCLPKGSFAAADYGACDQNHARNGASGSWTLASQTSKDTSGITAGANSTHAAGSGHRYTWSSQDTMGTELGLTAAAGNQNNEFTIAVCSMGSGNMLIAKHNRTSAGDDTSGVWARFWYQSNATWGSQFPIYRAQSQGGNNATIVNFMDRADDIDLTCTPNAAGVMTAHMVITVTNIFSGKNGPRVLYANFTDATYTENGHQTIVKWEKNGDLAERVGIALGAEIVADNSTGTIGIFTLDNYGRVHWNGTGLFGTQGFKDTGTLYINVTGAVSKAKDETDTFSMQSYYNGSTLAGTAVINGFIQTGSAETYVEWYNSSVTVEGKMIFYSQTGQPMGLTNVTMYSWYNQTEVFLDGSGGNCASGTCTMRMNPGWYTIIKLYRNNVEAIKISTTNSSSLVSFYVGNGYNQSSSFVLGNVSLTFTFYKETIESGGNHGLWPDPACSSGCGGHPGGSADHILKLDVWYGNLKDEITIDDFGTKSDGTGEDKRSFFVQSEPTKVRVRYDARAAADYNSSRWWMAGSDSTDRCTDALGCDIPITMYLTDFSNVKNYVYIFTLIDPTMDSFVNGTFLVKKYTPNGLITVSQQPIPISHIVEPTLQYREEYILQVRNAGGTQINDIALFIAEDTVSTNLIIEEITFTPEIIVQHKYIRWDAVHNRTAGTVNIWYRDVNNQTIDVNLIIWNMSGIQYSSTQTAQSFSLTWPGASSNATHTYWAKIVVNHNDFGEIIESKPISAYGSPANFIDFGRCPTCTDRLLPMDSPWFVYISGFATIFVAGLFSTASAVAGTLILAVWVAMMYQFGFFPGMETILMAFIMLFAMITIFAVARRESY